MDKTDAEKQKEYYEYNTDFQRAKQELNISTTMGHPKEWHDRSNYTKAMNGYIAMKKKLNEANDEILKAKQETQRFQDLLHNTLEENIELKKRLNKNL